MESRTIRREHGVAQDVGFVWVHQAWKWSIHPRRKRVGV